MAPIDRVLCSLLDELANALQGDDSPSENPSGRQHQMRLRELTIRYAPLPIPLTRLAVTTPRDAAALLFSIPGNGVVPNVTTRVTVGGWSLSISASKSSV
jgi:hypothetical protein